MRELDQNFCFYLSFIIAASKTLRFSLFSEIATVTTAYNAVTADQLSLSPGQLILVKRKHPDGWWEGELQVMSWRQPVSWKELVPAAKRVINRPFPSSPGPLFQNEGRCLAFGRKISFHSHTNKNHFHKKGCAPSLILKVRVFGTRK